MRWLGRGLKGMSNPKRPLPEHLATQIASPGGRSQHGGPGNLQGPMPQGPTDRRTAALPEAPVPLSAPTDRTMMFDPSSLKPRQRPSVKTVMSMPTTEAPSWFTPARKRWIGGPTLAAVVCVLTVWISGIISPANAAHPKGRLRISSDPEGATVIVDGRVHLETTPTTIEGDIGATLHIGFRLDGYSIKETDVLVSEGERPFRAHLEPRTAAAVPDPEPEPEAEPSPVPTPTANLEPQHAAKDLRPSRKASREPHYEQAIAPALTGTGTVSVHVRPWAIVYIDGNKVRQTPLDNYTLSAGLHHVELVNDGLKKREKVIVELRNGANEEVRREWGK